MTAEDIYFAIGWAIYACIVIATPVFFGFQKARGHNTPEAVYFWGLVFAALVIPLWAFAIVGAITVLICLPFVKFLNRAGRKIAERRP
jgi:Na+/phosphate symporter